MISLRYSLPIGLLLILSACAGFEPLYAQNTGVRQGFEQISASPIEGRVGFLFSQALQERGGINTGQSGAYVLETSLNKTSTAIGVRIDNVSTRARLTMRARFVVRDKNGKIAYRGNAQSSSAFDEPDQPYGALAAERRAEEIAAQLLAEKVLNDLAVFFAGNSENN